MPKRPRIDEREDGSAVLRLRIGPSMWRLITRRAKEVDLYPEATAKLLLEFIDACIKKGQITWLPYDWQFAHKAVTEDGPPEHIKRDLTKLHRSAKTKSGFVGVYANGSGFRAAGRNGAYIGQYASAEEAAWERRKYYKKHNLPYGELEVDVDIWRSRGETGTDAEIARTILHHAQNYANTYHIYEPWVDDFDFSSERSTSNTEDDEPVEPAGTHDTAEPKMLGFKDFGAAQASLEHLDEQDAKREAAERRARLADEAPDEEA